MVEEKTIGVMPIAEILVRLMSIKRCGWDLFILTSLVNLSRLHYNRLNI
jgi:hypothetical protein